MIYNFHFFATDSRTLCGLSIGPHTAGTADIEHWLLTHRSLALGACLGCRQTMQRWAHFSAALRQADKDRAADWGPYADTP